MFKNILSILTLLSSTSAFSIECRAIDRYNQAEKRIVETEIQLVKTYDVSAILKLEGALNGKLYFLTYDGDQGDALMQIVDGNDYTKGVVSRSAFNKHGRMSLSQVDGESVHRLECSRD